MSEKNIEKKKVSFSQYSGWFKCPHSWYLNYLKGLREYESSLNTCFGSEKKVNCESLIIFLEHLFCY